MMAASIISMPNAQETPRQAKVICITSKFKRLAEVRRLNPTDPAPEPPKAA